MAISVPYTGVPNVSTAGGSGMAEPQRAPDANAFGAQVGAAERGLGSQLDQVSNMISGQLIKDQELLNDASARDLDNQYFEKESKLRATYREQAGKNGVEAYQPYIDGLKQLRTETLAQAPNGMVAKLADATISKRVAFSMADGASHYAVQAKVYNRGVTAANTENAITGAVNSQSFPEFDLYLKGIETSASRQAVLDGATEASDDPVRKAAVDKNVDKAVLLKVQTLAMTDPVAAKTFYDKYQDRVMNKAQAETYIRQSESTVGAAQIASQVINGGGKPGSKLRGGVSGAIIAQESGGNPNIRNSIDGAQGIGQIMPETFKQYALPGERIDKPEDNLAVHERIIDDYNRRYDNDAARVAVAYFSGPGNVAPAGASTPYIRDKVDGNGKSVSSYVSDVLARMQKQPGAADVLTPNTTAVELQAMIERGRATAMEKYGKDPVHGEAIANSVETGIKQRYTSVMGMKDRMEQEGQNALDNFVLYGPQGGKPPVSTDELTADPNRRQFYENLKKNDPKRAKAIDQQIELNASPNDIVATKATNDRVEQLYGLAQIDPMAFGKMDFIQENLPKADKQRLQTLKLNLMKEAPKSQSQIVAVAQPLLDAAGLTKDDPKFQQFVGALQQWSDDVRKANKNIEPGAEELKKKASSLLAERTVSVGSVPGIVNAVTGFFGAETKVQEFVIPKADRDRYTEIAKKELGRNPTEQELSRAYNAEKASRK